MAYVTSRLLRSGALFHRHLHSQPLRSHLGRSDLFRGGDVTTGWQSKISKNFHSNGVRRSQPRKGGQPLYSLANSVACVVCKAQVNCARLYTRVWEFWKAKQGAAESKGGWIKVKTRLLELWIYLISRAIQLCLWSLHNMTLCITVQVAQNPVKTPTVVVVVVAAAVGVDLKMSNNAP